MAVSGFRRAFAPVRRLLPPWLANPIRNIATALLMPALVSYRTGHFRSSLKMAAVSRDGEPIPWYTYAAIDFLRGRSFKGKSVLEFGGGQSTLWWAARAASVVTFEEDRAWHDRIKTGMPANVELHHVDRATGLRDDTQVSAVLAARGVECYDIVVIDGLTREQLFDIACRYLAPDGILICDNSEGYGFMEGLRDRGLLRADFYGNAPGVLLPHCTSIYFSATSFAFDASIPIRAIAED